ncbi:MAG: hypothetical protein OXH94_10545 [Rhodospirillales bacterium]|nr:hypothetical protein [Rhodospirillales bacterium]
MLDRYWTILLASAVILLQPPMAEARQWRATPMALAQDYVQIIDQRSPSELVIVFWISPQLLQQAPANKLARRLMAKNMVVGIVHADISPGGSFTFRTPAAPTVDVALRGPQTNLPDSEIEPAALGVIETLRQMLGQALGPAGKGFRWFTFDGSNINSCADGAFAIKYADESYTFETPIPGCDHQRGAGNTPPGR